MLNYAVGLFFAALAATFLGITGVVGSGLKVARILFLGAVFLFVAVLVGPPI